MLGLLTTIAIIVGVIVLIIYGLWALFWIIIACAIIAVMTKIVNYIIEKIKDEL